MRSSQSSSARGDAGRSSARTRTPCRTEKRDACVNEYMKTDRPTDRPGRARVRLGRRGSTTRRAPAARRHRAYARRGAPIETRRRVGRTRARDDGRTDGARRSDERRERRLAGRAARDDGRPTASSYARRRRVSPARDARASGRRRARRDPRARRQQGGASAGRTCGARVTRARADAGPRPRRRATRFFILRRPTRGDDLEASSLGARRRR